MAVQCPKCRADNPETQKFCGECGTPLPSTRDIHPEVTETIKTPLQNITRGIMFAGRYEVIEDLGKGGMGKVYRVFDKKIDEEVALKLIKSDIAADKETIKRFSNELKLARKIAHRNVGKMYELMEEEGTHFITMEYVPGENLKSMIRMSGQLGAGTAVTIAKQICEGLEEAHRLGVVHRDLKPSNIMIDREGTVRIMDFGIARSLKGRGITGAGIMIGTPEYMSPEQVEGKDVDARSDIYSLGVILYEMVTGRVPFEGDTPFTVGVKHKSESPMDPRQLNSQIPEALSRSILRCLEKDKEKRFQSAAELSSELESLSREIPATQKIIPSRKPLTSREITVKFRLRNLVRPILAVVFIAIVAVVIWRIGFKKEVALVPGGKPSLAVLYFKNNTGDADFEIWRSALSDSIITDLSQSRYINVLSTDRLLSVLRKLGLLEATGYASEDLERIAAEGGANHVLQGTLSRAGDLFRIDYTLQEVGSGKIIGTSRVEGRGEASMFAMVDELTRKIKQDLKLSEAEIAGDFDKSIGQITTSSPEAYKLYIEAARLHSLGENRKAIPYYEKAVSIDSEFATAYRSMGIAYNNLGYAAKSREYRKKAFELSDRVSDRERYRNAAEYYALSDRTVDKEIEAFKKLLALYPDDRSANTNLGVTYMLLEEWDLAIERLNICLQLKDESPYAYSALAWCYMAKGKFEEAREILELYLDDFSENAYIRFSAADQYLCGGKYELAYAEIDRALALAPDDFTYIFTKGIIHQCEGNLAEAEKEYQRLLELEEPVAQVWRLSCMENLRVLQGKITESQDFLKTAIESVRKTEEKYWECLFLYRSSYNHLLLGNPQQALPLMDRVMNLSLEWENDFWRMMALHMKGMAALKLKDRDIALEAAGELKKVLDKSSYKKEIRLYYHLMGQIEMEKNNLPKATEYFEKAVSLLPGQSSILFEEGHAQYMDSLAMAYFQAGDLEKAREEYEKILTLTTGRFYFGDIYAKSFYMLGKIAEQRGGKSEAIERYSQFLDLWKDADPGIPEVEDARRRLEGLRALNPS